MPTWHPPTSRPYKGANPATTAARIERHRLEIRLEEAAGTLAGLRATVDRLSREAENRIRLAGSGAWGSEGH